MILVGLLVTTVTAVTKKWGMVPLRVTQSYAGFRVAFLCNLVGGHCSKTGYGGYSGYSGYRRLTGGF